MTKPLLMFIIIVTAHSSSLQAYQATLWPGNSVAKQSSDTPFQYTCTYPHTYDNTYERGLALGGYSFDINYNISFTASITAVDSSSDTITFNIQDDLVVYYISFHILLVDTASPWLFIESFTYITVNVNQKGASTTTETVNVLFSNPLATTVGWVAYVSFTGYSTYATVNRGVQIKLIQSTLTTTSVDAIIDRRQIYRMVLRIQGLFLLVNYDIINSDLQNKYLQLQTFVIDHAPSTTLTDPLINEPVNYGFGDQYLTSPNAFDGNCMMMVSQFFIEYDQKFTFYADLTINPIQRTFFLDRYGFSMIANIVYKMICSKQYYNSSDCSSKFGFEYCYNCSMVECISCATNFYNITNGSGTQICVTAQCGSFFSLYNCSECVYGQCLLCSAGFYKKNLNGSIFCASSNCQTDFQIQNCTECIFRQCLSCESNFTSTLYNGSIVCVTNNCLGFTNCAQCLASQCILCEGNFSLTAYNGSFFCTTSACEIQFGFLNCSECIADGCLICSPGFTSEYINGSIHCVTSICDPYNFYNCNKCTYQECLECDTDFYMKNINGSLLCATVQCNAYFNYTNCTECVFEQCFSCQSTFYTVNINSSILCATTNCLSYFGHTNCTECLANQCIQCSTSFYLRTINSSVQCATTLCPAFFSYLNCVQCISEECLTCDVNFYLMFVNNTQYCGTLQCQNRFNYLHCYECIASQCLSCTTDFYFSNINGTRICLTNLCQQKFNYQNCQECTSLECLSCEPFFYSINVRGLPTCVTQNCTDIFNYTNCFECSSIQCLQCVPDFYLKYWNGQNVCATQNCTDFYNITNCSECIPSQCLICGDNFTQEIINGSFSCITELCQLYFNFSNCIKCNAQTCLLCDSDFYLELRQFQSNCYCLEGNLLNGICNQIQGCADPVRYSDGSKGCLACDDQYFKVEPVNGQCQCLQGQKVNGICNTVVGCIFPNIRSDGSIGCQFCNVSAGFNNASNNQGLCTCQQYFQANGNVCSEICGDGVLIKSIFNACDDGNINSGDGCSSSCQIQQFYRCYNTDKYTPTICLYSGIPMQTSLASISNHKEANTAIFQFNLYPDLLFLSKLDFLSCTTLICGSVELNLKSADYSQGTLKIISGFEQDLDNSNCQLNITYDQSYTLVDDTSFNFDVVSKSSLVYIADEKIEIKKKVSFSFKMLSYFVIAVFLISLRHKMIGVELIVTCQMVYFSYAFNNQPSFMATSIQNFNLVTSSRSLFTSTVPDSFLDYFCSDFGLSKQFIENNAIWLVIIVPVTFTMLILMIMDIKKYKKEKESQPTQNVSKKLNQIKSQEISTVSSPQYAFSQRLAYFYTCVVYPFVVFNLIMTLLTLFISMLRTDFNGQINKYFNSIAMLIGCLVSGGVVCGQIVLLGSSGRCGKVGGVYEMKIWYVPFFLLKTVIFVIILQAGTIQFFDSPKIQYSIAILLIIYFIIVLFFRPYIDNKLSLISIIVNESLVLFSFGLALLKRILEIDQNTQMLCIIALVGVITISVFLTLIRTLRYYYKLYQMPFGEINRNKRQKYDKTKKKKKNDQKQDQDLQVQLFNSLNPYKAQLIQKVNRTKLAKEKRNIFEPRQDQDKQEDQQVVQIKNRLRKAFYQKKAKQQFQLQMIL